MVDLTLTLAWSSGYLAGLASVAMWYGLRHNLPDTLRRWRGGAVGGLHRYSQSSGRSESASDKSETRQNAAAA